jgi:hypothetical protein
VRNFSYLIDSGTISNTSGTTPGGFIGAGNPSGGTGGLLIIIAKSIRNNGSIVSNGTAINCATRFTAWSSGFNCAGGSGGGSIQMFYKYTYSNTGTITVTPGERAGAGSIRVMKLSTRFDFEL